MEKAFLFNIYFNYYFFVKKTCFISSNCFGFFLFSHVKEENEISIDFFHIFLNGQKHSSKSLTLLNIFFVVFSMFVVCSSIRHIFKCFAFTQNTFSIPSISLHRIRPFFTIFYYMIFFLVAAGFHHFMCSIINRCK